MDILWLRKWDGGINSSFNTNICKADVESGMAFPLSQLSPTLPTNSTECLSPCLCWLSVWKKTAFIFPGVQDFSLSCTMVHHFCSKAIIRYNFLHLSLLCCIAGWINKEINTITSPLRQLSGFWQNLEDTWLLFLIKEYSTGSLKGIYCNSLVNFSTMQFDFFDISSFVNYQ